MYVVRSTLSGVRHFRCQPPRVSPDMNVTAMGAQYLWRVFQKIQHRRTFFWLDSSSQMAQLLFMFDLYSIPWRTFVFAIFCRSGCSVFPALYFLPGLRRRFSEAGPRIRWYVCTYFLFRHSDSWIRDPKTIDTPLNSPHKGKIERLLLKYPISDQNAVNNLNLCFWRLACTLYKSFMTLNDIFGVFL